MRKVIIVDVESTGLDPRRHVPVEVAAVDLDSGQPLCFVPYLDAADLAAASPQALAVNGYAERGLAQSALTIADTLDAYARLWDWLDGATLAGCNPRFDADMLTAGYRRARELARTAGVATADTPITEVWHYHLADLAAYTAGALALGPGRLPGLARTCELLGVANDGEHTALGDAVATAECFHRIAARAGSTP